MEQETKLPEGLELAQLCCAHASFTGVPESDARTAHAAIRDEHTQRLTLQHHAADMAQRVADLEAQRDSYKAAFAEWMRPADYIRGLVRDGTAPIHSLGHHCADVAIETIKRLIHQRDELRARLAELERQEPVAHLCRYRSGEEFASLARRPLNDKDVESSLPLYARPVHAIPEGWKLVNAGALAMVVNALRRDAEEGRPVRGEMVDELLAAPEYKA